MEKAVSFYHANVNPASSARAEAPAATLPILVVEDAQANVLVATLLLETLGYTLSVAENGLKAMELFKQRRFAAVLMDLNLPDIDGFTITRQMRDYERAQNRAPTPIIAMTSYATRKERKKALASGMDDFLTKPVDQEKLAQTLTLQMARKSQYP